jgi:hypothetical protein
MTVKAALLPCMCAIAAGAFAQPSGMSLQADLTLQSRDELEHTIGDARQAQALIAGVISDLAPSLARSEKDPRELSIIAEQLPAPWLPAVSGVTFRRVDWDVAKRGWENDCLLLLWIAAKVETSALTITVTEGNKCHQRGSHYLFLRTAEGWRFAGTGSASGFTMRGDPCACR